MPRTARGRLGRLRGARSPVEPSFIARREQLRRVRLIGHDFGIRDPIFEVNGKLDAHAWAGRLGVRHASVLARVARPEDLMWSELPDRFVLKPVRGAGSSGVYLLHRRGQLLRDVRDGTDLSPDVIVERLHALIARGKISAELLVEEFVQDARRPDAGPVDWKFSTFFGRVGVVEGKVAGPGGPAFKLFDARWRDLGHGFVSDQVVEAEIAPPVHAGELLDAAARISACLPRPFVRVDLYDSLDGPVFGEITPEPGGPVGFRPDIDRFLGECWDEAEARLLLRDVRAGSIHPADMPLPESGVLLHRRAARPGPDAAHEYARRRLPGPRRLSWPGSRAGRGG